MSTNFVVTAVAKPDIYRDNVSIGDAVSYSFDLTPWQEDNSTVTSVTWTSESGEASISNQSLSAGTASALISFSTAGRNLISLLISTASQKKKIWLEIYVKDVETFTNDYALEQ